MADKSLISLAYPTDLNDAQWALIAPLLPSAKHGGRPRKTDLRRVCDAIFYLVKNGCLWSSLPSDFPPKSTVHRYFTEWTRKGVIRKIHQRIVKKIRRSEGKTSYPTVAVIDSQTVETGRVVPNSSKGYDGGKHKRGRKRHVVTDTLGLPIAISVTPANVHDTKGGRSAIRRVRRFLRGRKLKKVYGDGGYSGEPFKKFVKDTIGATMHVSKGIGRKALAKVKGFVPVAKRWVVERTHSWFGIYRRLAKDQEKLIRNSVAMLRLASVHLLLRRLFPASEIVA